MRNLVDFLGNRVIGVAAQYDLISTATATDTSTYTSKEMDVYICSVTVRHDNGLTVHFPKGHKLEVGNLLTLHLDNRSGVSEYDADLKVYRLSYKGEISAVNGDFCEIKPREFQVYYGISVEMEYREADYQFPKDCRPVRELPITPLTELPDMDLDEHDNKIGVLITKAMEQPHSTVMAFLSSSADDVFFITFPNTFKSQLLSKDNECHFAIDSRATFNFDEAIHWNYSIIKGTAHKVPKENDAYHHIKDLFIEKNPFEVGFFTMPDVEMYHITPNEVICPAAKRRL